MLVNLRNIEKLFHVLGEFRHLMNLVFIAAGDYAWILSKCLYANNQNMKQI